eukprot:1205228-Prymnesium_polylepis.1
MAARARGVWAAPLSSFGKAALESMVFMWTACRIVFLQGGCYGDTRGRPRAIARARSDCGVRRGVRVTCYDYSHGRALRNRCIKKPLIAF